MYAKIFASMWDGSIAQHWEAWTTFVYLLANCDPEGFIDKTPHAIAAGSGLPLEVVRKGLEILEAPDPESRSQGFGGCRLERIDAHRSWGWRIVNYLHYRTLADPDVRREQNRQAQKRSRAKKRSVSIGQRPSASVSACQHKQKEIQSFVPPTAHGVVVAGEVSSQDSQASLLDGPLSLRTSSRGVKRAALQDAKVLPPDEITADDAFGEVFWPEYPRKVGRLAALKAWQRLKLRDDDEAALRAIMAGLRRDKSVEWRDREPHLIPHAATWIHQRRWEDQ